MYLTLKKTRPTSNLYIYYVTRYCCVAFNFSVMYSNEDHRWIEPWFSRCVIYSNVAIVEDILLYYIIGHLSTILVE